jgi:hypothetical protein
VATQEHPVAGRAKHRPDRKVRERHCQRHHQQEL